MFTQFCSTKFWRKKIRNKNFQCERGLKILVQRSKPTIRARYASATRLWFHIHKLRFNSTVRSSDVPTRTE